MTGPKVRTPGEVGTGRASAETNTTDGRIVLAGRTREKSRQNPVLAWTDGACEPNPGRGGWGYMLLHPNGATSEDCGGAVATTNNRMEMMAILMALRALPDGQAVIVHSDSQYCVNGLTKWRNAWRRRDWRKVAGPIPNRDLWVQLEAELCRLKVEVLWVRGHNGNTGNERADVLASIGRRGLSPRAPTGAMADGHGRGKYADRAAAFWPADELDPITITFELLAEHARQLRQRDHEATA